MEQTIPWKQRLKLVIMAPSMYFFFFLLSFVEYVALIQGTLKTFIVKKSAEANIASWQHVERAKIG